MTIIANLWDDVKANKDAITLSVALLGAGLGVLNLLRDVWKTRRQERVRLDVVPKIGRLIGSSQLISSTTGQPDPQGFLVVEVVNRSYFPVFIDSLFLLSESHKGRECMVMQPSVTTKKEWPVKLERHESVTLYSLPTDVRQLLTIGARGVYVKTAANQQFEGASEIFAKIHAQYRVLPKTATGTVDWSRAVQFAEAKLGDDSQLRTVGFPS